MLIIPANLSILVLPFNELMIVQYKSDDDYCDKPCKSLISRCGFGMLQLQLELREGVKKLGKAGSFVLHLLLGFCWDQDRNP